MKQRCLLVTMSMVLLVAVAGRSLRGAEAVRQPNILLIITDQQFADAMSCRIGDAYLKTPAMDSLAARGTLFTRAYCANPLCVPSRTSIFTGRYPHETGTQTNGRRTLDAGEFPCLGTIFQQAGYDTGYVGKWHLPFNRKDSKQRGFDFMQNIKNNGADNASPPAAIEFLRKSRTKPFLLVASFVDPHNICEWARGQRLPDGPIGEPPPLAECPPLLPNHLPPRGETDIISLMRRSYQGSRTFPVARFDDTQWRQYIWAYYRMIEMVDRHIGTVLDALVDSGQESQTLVVFTSDHGDCHGAHLWNQKTVFYDESSRVPLIICGPGVRKAATSDRLVHTGVDLLPTLCDFAGLAIPEKSPGLSLKGTALGHDDSDPREYIVVSNKMVQGVAIDGVKPEPDGRMVRSRRFKYCVYSIGKRRESLVDMQNDSGEMVNLAEDDRHQTILQQHRQYLAQWCRKYNDDFIRFVPETR